MRTALDCQVPCASIVEITAPLEEQIVHWPEDALFSGACGDFRRLERVRPHRRQGTMQVGNLQLSAVHVLVPKDRERGRGELRAELTLEIGEDRQNGRRASPAVDVGGLDRERDRRSLGRSYCRRARRSLVARCRSRGGHRDGEIGDDDDVRANHGALNG